MRRKALTLVSLLVALAGLAQAADQPWIVVTLDKLEFTGNLESWPRYLPNPLMLASVVGSGGTYQKVAWPAHGWLTIPDEGAAMIPDTEAIPLFALPEEEMGGRLGIALVFLGNDTDFDWINRSAGSLLTAMQEVLSQGRPMVGPLGSTTWIGEPSASDLESAVAGKYGANTLVGVFLRYFHSGTYETATYTAEVGDEGHRVRFQYSVRKVFLPDGLRVRVTLEGIRVVENGDMMKGEVFVWCRTSPGFTSGGTLQTTFKRLPGSGHYSLSDGDEKVFATVLFEGAVHPFLYVEIAVWDEDEPSVGDDHDQLGIFCGLWLPWRLSNLPGGEKLLAIPKSTPSGEVVIFLKLRLL